MRATRSKQSLLRVCVLTSFIYLLCSTCAGHGLMTGNKMLKRGRRSYLKQQQHHRPLTDEQEADQNLQFMLSLYRSAAEPDGRPRQHRKFGSNTVRLLRPTTSSARHLPTSRDHHYSFTVHYDLDTLPSEQLVRASFIHLRSSSSTSSSSTTSSAQITSLGEESLVTLEPHEQWTETDITAHVQQGRSRGTGGHLTLTAQYWCTDPGHADEDSEPHVEVPSLLLYLEEEAEGSVADALKNAPSSSSSSLSFSTSPSASILAEIPTYKRKTGTPKNRCKLHSFRLSFDELGWGRYFIAPPVYNPRFCKGNCPRVLHYGYHSPHHAIIQTVINDLGVGDVPPPSCVPYKYMPMSVLVVDKKKVEYKELEDMVAESCTCR
uniref:Bone morphogenetic protein 15 n=1 Tax=Labrus bergylta TaxID=56723 RepID=A0A3Q3E4C1_9LABR